MTTGICSSVSGPCSCGRMHPHVTISRLCARQTQCRHRLWITFRNYLMMVRAYDSCCRLESGWAGSVLEEVAGSGGELCAHTAHHFARALHSYKGQQLVRSFYTPQAPTALALAPGEQGQLVCCAEEHMVRMQQFYHHLTLLDLRLGSRTAAMHLAMRTSSLSMCGLYKPC